MSGNLIARLEAASGPSDELALAVAEWCYENGGIGDVNYDPRMWIMQNDSHIYSIDVAMKLVPEGLLIRLGQYSETAPLWEAVIAAHDNDWWTKPVPCPTPAMALCIAALSAREPSGRQEEL